MLKESLDIHKRKIEENHHNFMFLDQNEPFVGILFTAYPAVQGFLKDLEKCKKYLVDSQISSINFALLDLLIREFSIDFDYYGKVL